MLIEMLRRNKVTLKVGPAMNSAASGRGAPVQGPRSFASSRPSTAKAHKHNAAQEAIHEKNNNKKNN